MYSKVLELTAPGTGHQLAHDYIHVTLRNTTHLPHSF